MFSPAPFIDHTLLKPDATRAEIAQLCEEAVEYGFAAGGATTADVRRLVTAAAGRAQVKAAGGIRDWPFCAELLDAGATRIGTSAGVAIMRQWRQASPRP